MSRLLLVLAARRKARKSEDKQNGLTDNEKYRTSCSDAVQVFDTESGAGSKITRRK